MPVGFPQVQLTCVQLELTTTVRHQNELLVTFCARLAALPKVMTGIRAVVVQAEVAPAAV
uniref:Uncharacterized protein n=1 Tax=Aegilops tauschii TaxID=37682 RepID=N1R5S2_AEGTA